MSNRTRKKYNDSIWGKWDGFEYLRHSNSKVDKWLNDHEILFVAILLFIMAVIVVVALLAPDNGHKKIASELTKAGYDVAAIEFTLIEKDRFGSAGKRIYKSSEPIEYEAGVYVDQWELDNISVSKYFAYYTVKPYPEIPSTIPVNLLLTITLEDYNLLDELAGEQEVEEYVKQLISNRLNE